MTNETQLRTLLQELDLEPPRPITGADLLTLADTLRVPHATMRRWMSPLAAAAAVVALAGLAVAVASSTGGSHRVRSAASTSAALPAVCTAAQMTASYTPRPVDPATKSTGRATPVDTALLVTLTNHSGAMCTVRGYIANRPESKPGGEIPVSFQHGVDGYRDPGVGTVRLDPGGQASFVVEILTAGSAAGQVVTSFEEFTLPGDSTPLVLPARYRFEVRLSAGQHLAVGVTALTAGSAWPAQSPVASH